MAEGGRGWRKMSGMVKMIKTVILKKMGSEEVIAIRCVVGVVSHVTHKHLHDVTNPSSLHPHYILHHNLSTNLVLAVDLRWYFSQLFQSASHQSYRMHICTLVKK